MMLFEHVHGRRYARFAHLLNLPGLIHAFSTRPENISARDDRQQADATADRERMLRDLGLVPEQLCFCRQVHGTGLTVVDTPRTASPLEATDAVITGLPGVALMTFSADCPLILAVDPERQVVGLAHASWRCTVARLTERLIATMCSRLGCVAARMLAGVGPGAGPCCYEVREDVCAAAAELPEHDRLFQTRSQRIYFDLWQANVAQLHQAGVHRENIAVAGICTMCRNDLFHSYRREGPGCGHFALLAAWQAT
ncbi:MAG: polyphenol oxidase family protein [Planctomycetes bacterium]|nr:polyphenol oxidase family protein [Planctomycetota bacterium]